MRRSLLALLAVSILSTIPRPAAAQRGALVGKPTLPAGKHCLDENRTKLLMNHTLVGSINPLGLENQLRISLCKPLIQGDGILFRFTNLDAGLANCISPTHVHLGPYLNVTPLSFLVLRAELTGLFIWPLPLPGAGFMPLPDYVPFTDKTVDPDDPDLGRRAYGMRAMMGATLQGAVPLPKGLALVAVNSFVSEYWRVQPLEPLDGNDFFYLARRDVVTRASGDWVLANTSVLLLNIDIKQNFVVRLGATNDLVAVPASGYIGNLVAGIAAVMVRRVGALARNLQLFIRAGGYTHHGFRTGMTLAAGLDVYYELLRR